MLLSKSNVYSIPLFSNILRGFPLKENLFKSLKFLSKVQIVFKDGQPVEQMIGVQQADQLESVLNKYL